MTEAKKATPRKTSRKAAAPDVIANMVAAQTAKAAAIMARAEATAAERILTVTLDQIHTAAEVERAAGKKADGIRATAFTTAIDAAREAGLDTGEVKDLMAEIVDRAVETGDIAKSTGRLYKMGLTFSIERHVPWTSTMHDPKEKVRALTLAKKAIPKALQAAAEKVAAEEAAKREAKNSKGHVASLDTVVKSLAKALADSRAIGRVELSADILDVIHSIEPGFVEPKAND
jgi:hypothetical protein